MVRVYINARVIVESVMANEADLIIRRLSSLLLKGLTIQGSKFKFEFGSTCATRCKFSGAQLKILGAQFIILGASISKDKVKSLTVSHLFVIFSLLLLLQSCD